jgi:hypothetical protein
MLHWEHVSVFVVFAVMLSLLLIFMLRSSDTPDVLRQHARRESDPTFAVVVHSMDGYSRIWPLFWHEFSRQVHVPVEVDVVFAVEDKDPEEARAELPSYARVVYTGKGDWCARLLYTLSHIDADYVLYLQEDYIFRRPSDLSRAWPVCREMSEGGLWHVKLHPGCAFSPFEEEQEDLNDPAWYAVSHHLGLWDKQWLEWTLRQGCTTCFQHEVFVNRHVHSEKAWTRCACKDGFYDVTDVMRRGKLTNEGERILNESGVHFDVEDDQVLDRPVG